MQSAPSANHEHLPISGHPQFLDAARDILFDSAAEGYAGIAAFQTIAGTGANHLGVLLVARATGIDFTKDQWKTLLRAELSASVRHRLVRYLPLQSLLANIHILTHLCTARDSLLEIWMRKLGLFANLFATRPLSS